MIWAEGLETPCELNAMDTRDSVLGQVTRRKQTALRVRRQVTSAAMVPRFWLLRKRSFRSINWTVESPIASLGIASLGWGIGSEC